MPNPISSAAAQARTLHQLGRDFFARHLSEANATASGDPGSRQYHSNVYEGIGKLGGGVVGLHAAPLALLAGLENEIVGGAAEKIQGRDFFSDQGFDWQDLEANKNGLGRGLREGFRSWTGR